MQGIPSLPELKLRYYELMIVYHQHYHNYLEICRCYKAIYESDGVQADAAQWQPVRPGRGRHLLNLVHREDSDADSLSTFVTT